MVLNRKFFFTHKYLLAAIFICLVFFGLYSTLAIVRHLHYQSYGYDLGINDQTVWRYSRFELPLTTIDPLPEKSKLAFHVELVYALISPFYWIWSARKMLLLVTMFILCSGGLAAYLLTKKRLKSEPVSFALLLSYLMFYGLQHAVWFDVHSSSFAAAFIMWFVYFLDQKKTRLAILFFFLVITAKENMASYTLVISLLYYIRRRSPLILFFAATSVVYLLFIFFIFFPHIMHVDYQYKNSAGLFSTLNPLLLFDTSEKLITIFFSFFSFGFLPILNPLTIPLIFTHFTTFFVIASDLPGAQGLYGHYRVTLDPLFIWSTVVTIGTFKFINKKYIALYLFLCTLVVQYVLHLPLSYLTKEWFWYESPEVNSINKLIQKYLPENASVVSQNNITPHISHREEIYTLYPTKHNFPTESPCGKPLCNWFTWHGNPEYLIVNTGKEWDARHLLANNSEFIEGLSNLEKKGIIRNFRQVGKTILYKVLRSPDI